ncbi:protein kinase domain-containing protein [Sorangium sp. So ce362]|uniref:protein kinase domain-containing protein n=1 Tax=Sorangium sp. So ce362 TaxID=3133303 RepID=UPI003F633329
MSAKAYLDPAGRVVELGEELGAGGEGSVFAVRGRRALCAKIYRPDRAEGRERKLRVMLERRPSWLLRRALAWPVALLTEAEGRAAFAGFLMPLQRGAIEVHRCLVPDERMQIAGWLTQRDLCVLAARLARLVEGVHRAGHCVGDLKPQNILVSPLSGRVALVDADSFQIRDPAAGQVHGCPVLTPEYTAPELCGAEPGRAARTPASDAFALAVLIHQLLLGGAHPFEGELARGGAGGAERIPARIRLGLCPFVPGVTGVRPAAGAIPFATLHPGLQALFIRCFGAGHGAPAERPGAAAWRAALLRAKREMIRCARSPAHLHDKALPRCPWCERRERTGIDLFPAEQRFQRAIARVRDPAAAPEAERIRWLGLHARGRLRDGALSAAERAWLDRAGAGLGLDRGAVARVVKEAAGRATEVRAGGRATGVGAGGRATEVGAGGRATEVGAGGRATEVGAGGRATEVGAGGRATEVGAGSGPARVWLPRGRVVFTSVASIAAAGACAAGVLVTSRLLATPGASPMPRPQPCAVLAQRATIGHTGGTGAYLRAAPSTGSDRHPLPDGTALRLTGRTRVAEQLGWAEVEVVASGRVGWVAALYLVQEAPR